MMKLKKTESYCAGYTSEDFLKRCAMGALGAAMIGSLSACATYAGGMTYQEYDGAQVCVSESDIAEDEVVTGSETFYVEPKRFASEESVSSEDTQV